MKIKWLGKTVFWVLLLFVAAVFGFNILGTGSAVANPASEGIGRFQIAAWGSYAGERVHHSGYYVLDTVTGKVVDKGHSVHGIGGTEPPD